MQTGHKDYKNKMKKEVIKETKKEVKKEIKRDAKKEINKEVKKEVYFEKQMILLLFFTLFVVILLSLFLTTDGRGFLFSTQVFDSNRNPVFITCINGAIIALSGAIYQTVFRNPLAVPTLLGASTGVNMGLLLLVLQYSTNAILMVKERYLYTYGCALGIVAFILLVGKYVGKSKISVSDMLLVGAVFSQIMNVVMMFYRFHMSLEEQDILQNFTLGRLTTISGYNLKLFLAITVIGTLPIFVLRYRINILSFGEEEALALGVNPVVTRVIVLMAGTLLYTASIIHCGSIGMISLVVPFLARMLCGANFRYLFHSSILFGAILLLICKDVQLLLTSEIGFVPVNVFVSVLGAPVFIFMLVKQRRYQFDS